jgi:predicted outer membrane repeat protein
MRSLISLYLVLLFLNSIHATTIHIPAEYPTIQQGINSSNHGDTVLVSPGTYYENINFNGKNIVLGSLFITTGDTSFISQTVLDGNQQGTVVTFESSEDSSTVLIGFSIRNGYYFEPHSPVINGGGITCTNNSNPRLSYLKIYDNKTKAELPSLGAGVSCTKKSCPLLQNVFIYNNTSSAGPFPNGYGGGLSCRDSSNVIIKDSIIKNNSAASHGGGISCEDSEIKLINVQLSGNGARYGGALYSFNGSIYLKNTKIKNNKASEYGGGIYLGKKSRIIFNKRDLSDIYLNESRIHGRDVFSEMDSLVTIDVDTFTVSKPNELSIYPKDKINVDFIHPVYGSIDGDIYVSPEGSDSNSGKSINEPFKTIDLALHPGMVGNSTTTQFPWMMQQLLM